LVTRELINYLIARTFRAAAGFPATERLRASHELTCPRHPLLICKERYGPSLSRSRLPRDIMFLYYA